MGSLEEKISKDLTLALKAGDKKRRQVLSLVKAALANARIAAKKDKLSDEEVITVLAREAKSRKEAAADFRKGHAEERAKDEEAEAAIIATYLPAQMSTDEVEKKVDEVIAKLNATDIKQMGQVMGALSKELKGQADLKMVNQLVQKKLAG